MFLILRFPRNFHFFTGIRSETQFYNFASQCATRGQCIAEDNKLRFITRTSDRRDLRSKCPGTPRDKHPNDQSIDEWNGQPVDIFVENLPECIGGEGMGWKMFLSNFVHFWSHVGVRIGKCGQKWPWLIFFCIFGESV